MAWFACIAGLLTWGLLACACLLGASFKIAAVAFVITAVFGHWAGELWKRRHGLPDKAKRASAWALGLTVVSVWAAIVVPDYLAIREHLRAQKEAEAAKSAARR